MRRVLVLGGTGWLGRAVAGAAAAGGAEVVCLARGESGDVPEGVRLITADRRDANAYDEVTGDWDDVVELAYASDLVEPALDALAARAAHWTLVSSVSVYARNDEPGADESAAVVEPTDATQYADAKVLAERITSDRVGDRLLIARPGLIAGPGDPSDRFGYWAARLSRGGPALVPTPDGRSVQIIDVADLAAWIEHAGRTRITGTINAVGHVHDMSDFFRAACEVTGFRGELVTLSDDALLAQEVQYWAGPRSLPLWLPLDDAALAQRDGTAFLASGGTLRPLRDTLLRTLADERERGFARPRRSGLTADEEADVLRSVRD